MDPQKRTETYNYEIWCEIFLMLIVNRELCQTVYFIYLYISYVNLPCSSVAYGLQVSGAENLHITQLVVQCSANPGRQFVVAFIRVFFFFFLAPSNFQSIDNFKRVSSFSLCYDTTYATIAPLLLQRAILFITCDLKYCL